MSHTTVSSPTTAQGETPFTRLMQYGLFALLLGIFYHANNFVFSPALRFWANYGIPTEVWVLADAGLCVPTCFRMTHFSSCWQGFFWGIWCVKRVGTGAFCKNSEPKRIGIPFSCWVGLFCLRHFIAVVIWACLCAKMVVASLKNPPPQPPMDMEKIFPLTHLWFLYCAGYFST